MNLKRLTAQMLSWALLGAAVTRAGTVTVTNDVISAETWYATNTYLLQTIVYVHSNAVLTIQPGTVIKGATTNQITREGVPKPASALWVARGGKLYATGTVERPIIFTFEGDPLNGTWLTNALGTPLSGQWGGVVLCGNAVINSAQLLAGNGSNPIYDRFEGLTGDGTNSVHLYGGNDDNDNSGELRYVSIRYPGLEFETARELNGLTMGGVGRGTTIEFVEVFGSSDDGFEWFGGAVNTKHLVAAFNEDDDFDTDQGYRGTNQFWFGIKPPWAGSTDSRGFETDGDLYQTLSQTNFPPSQWTVHNATLIGRGTNVAASSLGRGWNARDETAANVINSIITAFETGLLLDNDGLLYFTNTPPEANALNNIWGVVNATSGANGSFLFSDASRSNTVENPLLGAVSYTNDFGLNPRPQPGSPALGNVLPQSGVLTPTAYRGAFATNDDWADSWTALSTLGILGDGKPLVVVTNDVTDAETWYATNTYLLQTLVYVHSNAVLTIQPGTVIKGATTNQITREGVPKPASALWVARGGKLYATGTVERPIIFTFDGDKVTTPFDVPAMTSGRWGGVVLCGNAVINSAQLLAGNGSNPIYDRFEGLTGDGTNSVHLYGGNDDNDNSGELRYVSIRYPGLEFETARELNGLTMGGVGRGTTIEFVEVFGSSDDGFEWFGGAVNTKHLVAAFNEDDDFDTDQGYRGTNQFWFGIKPPWAGSTDSRGFETDGDLYQTLSQTNFPPSQWTVHNATLIGRGTNVAASSLGRGWNARDETAANVINSIITAFETGLLLDNDGLLYFTNTPPEANALNNIWGVVNATSGANGSFLFSDASRSNTVENPLLGAVSYTNDFGLNPRPQPGSPALGNVLPQSGVLTPTAYRGAFATNDLWAHKWTALYQLGYLQGSWTAPASVVPIPPQLSLLVTGSNLEIAFPTQPGFTYQVQTNTTITGTWGNAGLPISGTGGSVVSTQTVSGSEGYFRVVVQ